MITRKAMLPSDYLKRGFCAETRHDIARAICAFLDSFHDAETDEYWSLYFVWTVFAHDQVERLFPEWFARWHEANPGDDGGCCYPQDLADDFSRERAVEDCIQALDISEWPASDWESGLTKRMATDKAE